MLASLAHGTSRIVGLSDARHVRSTIEVLRGLGVGILLEEDGFLVQGGPYRPRRDTVNVGSSGTTLYFMIGLASLADAPVTLTGQKYFQRRPVGPLLNGLSQLGVKLAAESARPPITVQPRRPTGGKAQISGTLSQWISGLLLVAPFASGPTRIEVEGELNERPYVELTVSMMRQFGLEVDVARNWRRFDIEPNQEAKPTTIVLPPDIASAAFGLAASALHPADVVFRGLDETRSDRLDHPEAHLLDVLEQMGMPLALDEPAGGVRVRHDGIELRGVEVDCRPMPDMLPVLTTLGAFASGKTTFRNIEHVRLKESDRILSMLQLNEMGGDLAVDGDRLVVKGVRAMRGASLSSYNDHRVHMALSIAASRASGESSLTYPNAYRISYPAFLEDMRSLGIPMRVEPDGPSRQRPSRSGRARALASVAVDRAAEVPIGEWVRRWARERPQETAIVDVRAQRTRTWSWRELDETADRTAMLLLDLGVQPGEPVAYQLPNWGEFVALTLAVLRIGAVCCPLMPIYRAREVRQALARSKARVLAVAESFRGREHLAETVALLSLQGGSEIPLRIEHVLVVSDEEEPSTLPMGQSVVEWQDFALAVGARPLDSAALKARAPAAGDLAQLLFTSGTSGEPKGVLHRHDALTRAAAMHIDHFGLGRDERHLRALAARPPDRLPVRDVDRVRAGLHAGASRRCGTPRRLDAMQRFGGSFVQAATPFLADLTRVVEAGEAAPSAADRSWPPAPRSRASWPAGDARCSAPRSAAPGARPRAASAARSRRGTIPSAPGAPMDGRLPAWAARRRRRRGDRCRPGQEGNFEVLHRLPVRGVPEPPGPDRRGRHRGRLVSHRRPRAGSTRTATCGSPGASRT